LGLSQAKWRALLQIYKAKFKDGLNQTELASNIGIETPTLARMLDRLQKDGWIKRADCPSDRRAKFEKLTTKASHAMKIINKTANDTKMEILADVSEVELSQLVETLSKIRSKAEIMHNGV
jgi:MarR family transcriptional regulator for hemolysin